MHKNICRGNKGCVLNKQETAPEHGTSPTGYFQVGNLCSLAILGSLCKKESVLFDSRFVFLKIRWYLEKKEKSVRPRRLYVIWKKEMPELIR